jgi:translation initiation factor IF-2
MRIKMPNKTVEQLAKAVNLEPGQLLDKIRQAGVSVDSIDQILSDQEKQQLFFYLQRQKQLGRESTLDPTARISLKRHKIVSTLKSTQGTTSAVTITRTRKTFLPIQPEEAIDIQEAKDKPVTSVNTATIPISSPSVDASQELPLQKPLTTATKIIHKERDNLYRKEKKPKGLIKEKTAKHRLVRLDVLDEDTEEPEITSKIPHLSRKSNKSKLSYKKASLKQAFEKPSAPIMHEVLLGDTITILDLAQKMSVKAVEVIKQLMKLGIRVTINQSIDQETATLLVEEMGHTPKLLEKNILETNLQQTTTQQMGKPLPRPPVVTVMGHVDHGKTSLLDYIRRTKVAAREAGGITQHIGAYHVILDDNISLVDKNLEASSKEKEADNQSQKCITFLDTPGHAAFAAMRARGALLTDIIILIVAADDGVMPQTIEAIQHAQAAKVPIVVAINKIDKPGADIDHIQQALAHHQLIPEAWGGNTPFAPISAKTGQGINELLETIYFQAELLELKAPITGPAQGIIIESRVEKGRGPVATVLVQQGSLHKGDILIAGVSFGRVRALHDENGQTILSASPSIPVEVLGLNSAPIANDQAIVVESERKARELALFRSGVAHDAKLKAQHKLKAQDLFSQMGEENASQKTLVLVLKADVQGSVEALKAALTALSTSEVQIKLLAPGIGAITESDANLALASSALLLGFNVRPNPAAKQIIEREGLPIHCHTVIYDLLDQVKQVMSGLLAPLIKENILGIAIVRETFRAAKIGTIAGCYVTEGLVKRNHSTRILRDNVVIHQGKIQSLKHFKEDVSEVRAGKECGISLENYSAIQIGDKIEVYERITLARKI